MSGSSAGDLIDAAHREADLKDIDIDAVREIDTDVDGTTIRVLYKDAEDEVDQVGFDVTRPPGEAGYQMFTNRLSTAMRELVNHVRDDEDSDEADASETETDQTESDTSTTGVEQSSVESRSTEPDQNSVVPAGATVELSVSLSDDSLDDLQSEHASLLDEIDDRAASRDRVDDLEDRVDDLEDRLSSIEERLSLLAISDDNE